MTAEIPDNVSPLLREILETKKISLRALAVELSVHHCTIARIASGESEPHYELGVKIIRYHRNLIKSKSKAKPSKRGG